MCLQINMYVCYNMFVAKILLRPSESRWESSGGLAYTNIYIERLDFVCSVSMLDLVT